MRALEKATTLVLCIVVAAYAGLHDLARAEGTQHNETDLEFAQRMTAKVKGLQRQIDQLQEAIDERASSMTIPQSSPYGAAGGDSIMNRPNRAGGGFDSNPHARLRAKLNSLEKKAEKERERLQAPQGSESSAKPLDRKSIEKNVKRIERDVEGVQRDLYGR